MESPLSGIYVVFVAGHLVPMATMQSSWPLVRQKRGRLPSGDQCVKIHLRPLQSRSNSSSDDVPICSVEISSVTPGLYSAYRLRALGKVELKPRLHFRLTKFVRHVKSTFFKHTPFFPCQTPVSRIFVITLLPLSFSSVVFSDPRSLCFTIRRMSPQTCLVC